MELFIYSLCSLADMNIYFYRRTRQQSCISGEICIRVDRSTREKKGRTSRRETGCLLSRANYFVRLSVIIKAFRLIITLVKLTHMRCDFNISCLYNVCVRARACRCTSTHAQTNIFNLRTQLHYWQRANGMSVQKVR